MTLENLLNKSSLSPKEISDNLKYKEIKNSISEMSVFMKNDFYNTLNTLVNDIVEDRLYNYYNYKEEDKKEIPLEDKKQLLLVIYNKALHKLEKYINIAKNLCGEQKRECPHKEEMVVVPVQQQEIPQATSVTQVGDMFGY